MRTNSWKPAGMAMVIAVLAMGTLSCSNDDPVNTPPPGGSSSLVASASSPADGDATVTDTGSLIVNNGGTGTDELNFSEVIGATGHEITIVWDTTTHAVNSVQYAWGPAAGGPSSGFTQCDALGTPCDPAKVSVDFTGTKITFTNLTLPDAFGGTSVSTLNGIGRW